MKQIAVHILVKGKVQGIGFRAGTMHRAKQLGITGWVKNTAEGGVEIIAQGEEELVNDFVGWCSQGPILAEVELVKTATVRIKNYPNFSIRK